MTSTSLRWSIARTLDFRTSWTPHRNSTQIPAISVDSSRWNVQWLCFLVVLFVCWVWYLPHCKANFYLAQTQIRKRILCRHAEKEKYDKRQTARKVRVLWVNCYVRIRKFFTVLNWSHIDRTRYCETHALYKQFSKLNVYIIQGRLFIFGKY